MTLIILQTQIKYSNIYNIITFTLPLLSLVFLQSCNQEICFFLECHPTYQFRILFQPVPEVSFIVLRAYKTEATPYAKQHRSILSFTPVCTS